MKSLLILFALVLLGCSASPRVDLVVTNVLLVDGTGGEPWVGTVLIDKGLIVQILDPQEAENLSARKRIDGTGHTLIPGLWDVHVHLAAETASPAALDSLLEHGVTTVRDNGSVEGIVSRWSQEIEEGVRQGPRILYAGKIINGPPDSSDETPWHRFVDTPEEAKAAVDEMQSAGAHVIKVHRRLGREAYEAVLAEAEALGLKVVGHVPLGVSNTEACELGQAEVTHMAAVIEAMLGRSQDPPESIVEVFAHLKGEDGSAISKCFAENQVYFSPDLVMYLPIIESAGDMRAMTENLLAAMQTVVGQWHAAGVPMLVGTDAGATDLKFGSTVHQELELLVGSGLTPSEALQAATVNAARFHGLQDEVGTIEVGKRADLVLLSANPLEDIRNTRQIAGVIHRGVWLGD